MPYCDDEDCHKERENYRVYRGPLEPARPYLFGQESTGRQVNNTTQEIHRCADCGFPTTNNIGASQVRCQVCQVMYDIVNCSSYWQHIQREYDDEQKRRKKIIHGD
jgi:NADH pyrophosphatase NudC (nudix superfamily)